MQVRPNLLDGKESFDTLNGGPKSRPEDELGNGYIMQNEWFLGQFLTSLS